MSESNGDNSWTRREHVVEKSRNPHLYLSLSSGLRLLSEQFYYDEFRRFGMSKQAFRRFLRMIRCPRLQVGDTWLIEHNTFLACIRAITQAGQPDFVAPGARLIDKWNRGKRKGMVRELDIEFLRRNLPAIQEELIKARMEAGHRITSEEDARREVSKATDILFSTSLRSPAQRAESEERFLASVRRSVRAPNASGSNT